ncbi:MAG: heavy metal sensor histidine kinase [Rubrivivax sp.]|nr:heavy metal sensor histidine kinase [Rubrivivax sp.]
MSLVARRLSLNARLVAGFASACAVVLLGMALICAVAVNRHFENLDAEALGEKILLVKEVMAEAESLNQLRARLDDAMRHHPDLGVLVSDTAGTPLYSRGSLRPADWAAAARGAGSDRPVTTKAEDGRVYRAIRSPLFQSGMMPRTEYQILITTDTRVHVRFLSFMQATLWVYLALAVPLCALVGWWVARTGLAPLHAMKAQAQAVTATRLNERMPVDSVPVELAVLAQSLNDMLDRLQSDFRRLTDFSAELAHELRTPIGNVLTQAQVALAQPRDAGFYRSVLESVAEELDRLARTVADMLLLARAEHGAWLPRRAPIDLAHEVRTLLDFYEAPAADKWITMAFAGNAQIQGDVLMLRRAISNLLSNALRHVPEGGDVRVEISESADEVRLTVANTGPDIDAAALPHVFDRFFRAPTSRDAVASEGAGLGLSIVRAIIVAHGGTVSVSSTGGQTRFTLVLPQVNTSALTGRA